MKNSIQEISVVDLELIAGGGFSETVDSGLAAAAVGVFGIGIAVLITKYLPK